MTTLEEEAAARRAALVGQLLANGHARRPEVADAFRNEPRHMYVPRFTRSRQAADGSWVSEEVTRAHPDWLEEVYTDQVLLTSTWPEMSSSTVPSLMADMLDALDAQRGMTVTEIGTGTGYNAGLLGRLVGDENVLSLDVAPGLVSAASEVLAAIGHGKITVVCADGGSADTLRPDSTDRLIATCGVSRLPEVWRRAVRPGGVIVVPLGSGIAVLDIDEQHGAQGEFLPVGAYFMSLRPDGDARLMIRPDDPEGSAEPCTMPPSAWDDIDFTFLVSFWLPLEDTLAGTAASDELIVWHRDGSIAHIYGDGTARQAGPQRLADLLGRLWREFQTYGKPPRSAYGITITPDSEHSVVASWAGHTWAITPT